MRLRHERMHILKGILLLLMVGGLLAVGARVIAHAGHQNSSVMVCEFFDDDDLDWYSHDVSLPALPSLVKRHVVTMAIVYPPTPQVLSFVFQPPKIV